MPRTISQAVVSNFLGKSARWYKATIIFFLILNPILVYCLPGESGPFVAGWVLILEFIFCLSMALKCYPLQPGGLLAIEAVVLGLTSAESVYNETVTNFPVILLLMFMVAGIYFMKDLLLFAFSKLIVNVKSKTVVSLLFCLVAAVLSAFLDALTVMAVVISVGLGFYSIYHRVSSGQKFTADSHDHSHDGNVQEEHRKTLEEFRCYLRSLLMHAAIGTALGGVCTIVGEPQNLLIAKTMDWEFAEFFLKVAPISMPVLVVGLFTCFFLEKVKWFGYGTKLPKSTREILENYDKHETETRTASQKASLISQGCVAILLVVCLAFHLAEVGLIGLMVIVLLTSLSGITEEHQIGKAFEEALPFTSLLVVFFGIVAVIHDQHLFKPVTDWVLGLDVSQQPGMLFIANGLLSVISDNVFVATVYITEVEKAFQAGGMSQEHFNALAVAINTGTNIPSVGTPNGQAAFLFLLTSAVAPLIRLSYGRMVWMALPYTITMSITAYICIKTLL